MVENCCLKCLFWIHSSVSAIVLSLVNALKILTKILSILLKKLILITKFSYFGYRFENKKSV